MAQNTTFVTNAVLTTTQMNAFGFGLVTTTAGGTSSLSYNIITVSQTVLAGNNTELTNSSMTFVGIAGRLYRASLSARFSNTSGSGLGSIQCVDGSATILAQWGANQSNSSGVGGLTCQHLFTATGSVTRAWKYNATTGDASMGGATTATYVTIEDIGPSA